MRCIFNILIGLQIFTFSLFAQTSDISNQSLQLRFAKSLKLLGNEQYDLAINELQKLISAHPDFQPPYRKLVETYIYIDNLEKAVLYFQNLQTQNPENPYIYYALSRIDFQKGNNEKAIKNLKKCISLDPRYPETYGPFGGLPEIYKAVGQLDSGEKFFSKLIKEQPENPHAYYGMARVYMKQYHWDSAISMLNKSTQIDSMAEYPYHSEPRMCGPSRSNAG